MHPIIIKLSSFPIGFLRQLVFLEKNPRNMKTERRYDRLRREELEMKKMIAVILLASAIVLPSNYSVEASSLDAEIQVKKVQYIACVGWEDQELNLEAIYSKLQGHHVFHNYWKDLLNNYSKGTRLVPSKPIEKSVTNPAPEVEKQPEVEITPQPEVKPEPAPQPTPDVEQVPEPEVKPEVKPEIKPQPTPDVEQAPEVESQPETTPPTQQKPVEPEPEQPSQPSVNATIEQAVLNLTNVERQKAGLAPLQADQKLMESARVKSTDMSSKNYFSHTSPTYGSPFDQMATFGITYKSAAENIAQGQPTAEAVVSAWMASPGHRQNILDARFTHIGIGFDGNGNYWTQQFIQK